MSTQPGTARPAAGTAASPPAGTAAGPDADPGPGARARRVARVESKTPLGPDEMVDDKAMVIMPTDVARTDPFLALSEDWFSSPGFQWHPHRGLETVTTVLDGVLEHGDNAGNTGALEVGDIQWMTAGRGIIHRELAYRDEHVHTLQLWLNLPAAKKLVPSRYQDLRAADRPHLVAPGVDIDLVSGPAAGRTGPAQNHWPISGALISLEPDSVATYDLPAHDRAFAYVLAGSVSIAGRTAEAGQVAWSDPTGPTAEPASTLTFRALDPDRVSTVMLCSGQPIGEPVALGGPFVMNTKAEIGRAFEDFHRGEFGPVPRQARLRYR